MDRAQDGVANALRKEPNCHASQVMDGRSRLDRSDLDPDRTRIVGQGPAQNPGQTKDREKPQEKPSRTGPPKPKAKPKVKAKPTDSHFTRVQLNLVIAGLGLEGCDVEVKPANAGCKFRVPSPGSTSPRAGKRKSS